MVTAVFRLDYPTRTPEHYYLTSAPYRPALPPRGWRYERLGALSAEWCSPADLGFYDVHHLLTNRRVFRAGIGWMGAGWFQYPAATHGAVGFGPLEDPVVADTLMTPSWIRSWRDPERLRKEARLAWEAVAPTAPARAVAAAGRVSVVVVPHFYGPALSIDPAATEWIVVAYSTPAPLPGTAAAPLREPPLVVAEGRQALSLYADRAEGWAASIMRPCAVR